MLGLALLALGAVGWLVWKGHLDGGAGRRLLVLAGVVVTLVLLMRGQMVPGMAVGAVTAVLALANGRRKPAPVPPMDEVEARRLLGVGLSAGRDEIIAAHRQTIARVHPDRGMAAADMAGRVNAARDLLLARVGEGR